MSITNPTRAEIAITLLGSRLSRWARYPAFVKEIGLKGDERVLDFGSGWGDTSRYLAMELDGRGRVTALDVSSEWQEVARRRLERFENVDFVNADIRSAGLPNGAFDVVVVSYVLHDIPRSDRAAIVREMARVLKPNGLIHLREPTAQRHGMPAEEIVSLMQAAGLKESHPRMKGREYRSQFRKG